MTKTFFLILALSTAAEHKMLCSSYELSGHECKTNLDKAERRSGAAVGWATENNTECSALRTKWDCKKPFASGRTHVQVQCGSEGVHNRKWSTCTEYKTPSLQ